jgi:multiple sugar transport system substrate-binding protein
MEEAVDPAKEKNLSKTQIPYFQNGNPAAVIGGWHMMISKFSDKKKEVMDFVKYLLSDEAQELFYKESGYYPVVKKIYEDPYYQNKYKELTNMRGVLSHGVHRPAHEEYTRFSKIMSFYFEEAIKQNISVREALAKATRAIQKEETAIREM